jgi:hypothetical protein
VQEEVLFVEGEMAVVEEEAGNKVKGNFFSVKVQAIQAISMRRGRR